MSNTKTPDGSPSNMIGDIYSRMAAITGTSTELFEAYEKDECLADLACRAERLSDLAHGLSVALRGIDVALNDLNQ